MYVIPSRATATSTSGRDGCAYPLHVPRIGTSTGRGRRKIAAMLAVTQVLNRMQPTNTTA